MVIESFKIFEISIVGLVRRRTKPGDLKNRDPQCVYCTKKAITFLGSPYPQLPFGVNFALVQTRYHGDRKFRNFRNFHCRPCTAVDETGWFEEPWRWVLLLHRESDYIFRFSMTQVPCLAQVSALFAPIRELRFRCLHTRSFLLIRSLLWCKHGIMAKGRPGF